jgi:hypothetical protein
MDLLKSRFVSIESDHHSAALDQQACNGLADSVSRAGHHNNVFAALIVHSFTVNGR